MARNIYSNAHPEAQKEISRLVEGVAGGDHLAVAYLRERLGTSDGVYAFAGLVNTSVQLHFAGITPIWSEFAGRTVVGDFRNINWVDINVDYSNFKAADKGVARAPGVMPKVAEGERYQYFSLNSKQLGWGVDKYGAAIGFTWESFVNDPYNVVPQIPQLLAQNATNIFDANATRALVAAAASDSADVLAATTSPYTLPINAPFSLNALTAAKAQLVNRKGPDGNFINAGKQLVLNYTPAIQATVDNVFSITSIRDNPGSTTGQAFDHTPTISDIKRVNNRYLSYFATAAGYGGDTTWTLSVAPNGTDSPVLSAYLAGEEVPEVRVSGLAGYTPNGQALPFTAGSFDTDSFDLRLRAVNGAGTTGYGTYGIVISKGTGAA